MEELKILLRQAQNGDVDAYGQLVRRFQDMAVAYAYSVLGDFHLAEDAAQEAFIEAYHNLPKVYGPRAFPAWLRQIVFRQCYRQRRGKWGTSIILGIDDFQKISDAKRITIGVGVPTRNQTQICISTIVFQPYKARQTYSKQYLHPDEEEFFISGPSSTGLLGNNANIALAICYELSVPEHAHNAFNSGAKIYIASVAKFVDGLEKAIKRLAEIGSQYSMTVLMSNCVGKSDGYECAGKTSIWNNKGRLVDQLNDTNEGIIIFDTDTQNRIKKMI